MMMRNLIMWNMVSLDGRFEGANQTIDWFAFDDELEQYILDTQMSAGTLLFGRVTYQMMAAHWPSAEGEIADFMNSVPKVVASRTLETVEWNNTRLVNENVPDEVSKLKQDPGKDVFLFGSANLASTLTQHGLIDEFRLGVNPLVLGSGAPLFKDNPDRQHMQFLEARTLGSGVVILHYRPV